jgi:hypothetical protein
MKTISWLISLGLAMSGTTSQIINFDSAAPGTVPAGWSTVLSHPSDKWEVLKDASAPSPPHVFAEVSKEAGARRCPLAIWDKTALKDGDLSVKLKPLAGNEHPSGGLVWRYRDPHNYYLVQANARENHIVLYKVEGGKFTALAPKGTPPKTYGVKHTVPSNQWSLLKVQFRGPLFSIYFNHKRLFQVVDSTFPQAGKVGLWTKPHSVTYFDDFRVAGK